MSIYEQDIECFGAHQPLTDSEWDASIAPNKDLMNRIKDTFSFEELCALQYMIECEKNERFVAKRLQQDRALGQMAWKRQMERDIAAYYRNDADMTAAGVEFYERILGWVLGDEHK